MANDKTQIQFRGGERMVVEGSLEQVASAFRGSGPVRLATSNGGIVFVNWANVLYFQEWTEPASDG